MWSPQKNANQARNEFYDNMGKTTPGDVVFSFKDTFIKAIGIVAGPAMDSDKPSEFQSVENSVNKSITGTSLLEEL